MFQLSAEEAFFLVFLSVLFFGVALALAGKD